MFQCPLSYNERLTLYGLVRYPLYNDRELSQELGLKMTTLTSIKNRLKAADFFDTVRYPALNVLDRELMVIRYGRFDPSSDNKECLKFMQDHEAWAKSSILSLLEGPNFLSLSLHKNYTQTKKENYRFETAMYARDLGDMSDVNSIILPLSDASIRIMFDHSTLLQRTLDLPAKIANKDRPLITHYKENRNKVSLKSAEIKVLHGLVKDPELPDSQVARNIGLTRQAVSRIKRKMEAEGIIGTSRAPNIKRLGYEILVFNHHRHGPSTDSKQYQMSVERLMEKMCLIFFASNATEACFIGVARDFGHYQLMKNAVCGSAIDLEYCTIEPDTMLLSIPSMEFVRNSEFREFLHDI